MKGLGFHEEVILLLFLAMGDDAYGFSVSEAYEKHTGKSISISAVHAAMSRVFYSWGNQKMRAIMAIPATKSTLSRPKKRVAVLILFGLVCCFTQK